MSVIDDYLANVPEPQRTVLERIRRIALDAVPEPLETISYGMPVIKYQDKYVIGFAPFRDHLSVFPGGEAIEKLAPELGDYKTARGTVQFGAHHPLPVSLVKAMVDTRVAAITKASSS